MYDYSLYLFKEEISVISTKTKTTVRDLLTISGNARYSRSEKAKQVKEIVIKLAKLEKMEKDMKDMEA